WYTSSSIAAGRGRAKQAWRDRHGGAATHGRDQGKSRGGLEDLVGHVDLAPMEFRRPGHGAQWTIRRRNHRDDENETGHPPHSADRSRAGKIVPGGTGGHPTDTIRLRMPGGSRAG